MSLLTPEERDKVRKEWYEKDSGRIYDDLIRMSAQAQYDKDH
ncbi:unnamed protein product, partial [marine sediment metagenome]